MRNKPFFTIVIPSLNEEQFLPKLLEDLSNQTFTDFEVIHVDGGSEDATVTRVAAFKNRLKLKLLTTSVRNVSHQRNIGSEHATADWIIFMDSDNRLPSYFLEGIKYQLSKNQNTDVFTTWINVEEEETLDGAVARFINLGIEFYKQLGKEAAIGALIGTKTSIAKEIHFDEKQKVFEDAFFVQVAVRRGYVFSVFKEPRYYFSLRRLRTEGKLKMAGSVALLNLRYIQGKSFDNNNFGYVMKGGSYYTNETISLFHSLEQYVKKASKNQLQQMKTTLQKIKEYME
jgi:glycosyltransferase involved in cell wall biosynthesis